MSDVYDATARLDGMRFFLIPAVARTLCPKSRLTSRAPCFGRVVFLKTGVLPVRSFDQRKLNPRRSMMAP